MSLVPFNPGCLDFFRGGVFPCDSDAPLPRTGCIVGNTFMSWPHMESLRSASKCSEQWTAIHPSAWFFPDDIPCDVNSSTGSPFFRSTVRLSGCNSHSSSRKVKPVPQSEILLGNPPSITPLVSLNWTTKMSCSLASTQGY